MRAMKRSSIPVANGIWTKVVAKGSFYVHKHALARHSHHYRNYRSIVTFRLVTQGSPVRSGTVHSSTSGPFPESYMTYTLPLPDTRSLIAARERYVVLGFCRGLISAVWSEKPAEQFHAFRTSELASGTAKRIRLVRGVSCVHCGSAPAAYRGWLSWATIASGERGWTVTPVAIQKVFGLAFYTLRNWVLLGTYRLMRSGRRWSQE